MRRDCGAGVGSQLSPALCNVATTLVEHSWRETYHTFLQQPSLHLFNTHSVDNRYISAHHHISPSRFLPKSSGTRDSGRQSHFWVFSSTHKHKHEQSPSNSHLSLSRSETSNLQEATACDNPTYNPALTVQASVQLHVAKRHSIVHSLQRCGPISKRKRASRIDCVQLALLCTRGAGAACCVCQTPFQGH